MNELLITVRNGSNPLHSKILSLVNLGMAAMSRSGN